MVGTFDDTVFSMQCCNCSCSNCNKISINFDSVFLFYINRQISLFQSNHQPPLRRSMTTSLNADDTTLTLSTKTLPPSRGVSRSKSVFGSIASVGTNLFSKHHRSSKSNLESDSAQGSVVSKLEYDDTESTVKINEEFQPSEAKSNEFKVSQKENDSVTVGESSYTYGSSSKVDSMPKNIGIASSSTGIELSIIAKNSLPVSTNSTQEADMHSYVETALEWGDSTLKQNIGAVNDSHTNTVSDSSATEHDDTVVHSSQVSLSCSKILFLKLKYISFILFLVL